MTDEFKGLIAKTATGATLSREEAARGFDTMMSGEATPSQMGGLLMALRVRGETVEEITGAVTAMREKMLRVVAPANAVDVVGTGGDASGSFNISTCAAFIVAGAGVPVAKHGNRALSSRSGAADVLGALGVNIELAPEGVSRCIREAGIGFMFAPAHHPAMKNVGPTRVELGTRTIFNLLGPLSNPAGVKRQMVGVFSRQWVEPLAHVLKNSAPRRSGSSTAPTASTRSRPPARPTSPRSRTVPCAPSRSPLRRRDCSGSSRKPCAAAMPTRMRRPSRTCSRARRVPSATSRCSTRRPG